jgi:L-cysteine S-thiosulfotransferase
MQDNEAPNPGMLTVLDGGALWQRPEGATGKSCANCHGDAHSSMKGAAARYPAYDGALGRPIDLEQRIVRCRTEHHQGAPLSLDSPELLALSAYVAHQSKGAPIEVADDAQTRSFIGAGKEIFERRQGQLSLSCAQCHDDNWGRRLGGSLIPQAHPTGYPIYRLEWQTVGSLRRRLRNCLVGMRAAAYGEEAPEIVELELYLGWRARGLAIETPAVRP